MSMMKALLVKVVLGTVVTVAVASCAPGKFLTPPTGPGTPYPCGYYGVSCMPYDGSHTCCHEGGVCIKDGCDYVGVDHTFGAGSDRQIRFPER